MGETMPRINAGAIKSIAESRTMRGSSGTAATHAGARWASGRISRVVAAPASRIRPKFMREAARSARTPPAQLPRLIPAKITPITLVQVYTDTPMCGARIRAATISMIRVAALAMKTTR